MTVSAREWVHTCCCQGHGKASCPQSFKLFFIICFKSSMLSAATTEIAQEKICEAPHFYMPHNIFYDDSFLADWSITYHGELISGHWALLNENTKMFCFCQNEVSESHVLPLLLPSLIHHSPPLPSSHTYTHTHPPSALSISRRRKKSLNLSVGHICNYSLPVCC